MKTKTNLYQRVLQRLMQLSFLLAVTLLAGCDLFDEDDEETPCSGEVVLTARRHDSFSGGNVKIGDPIRYCYSYNLIEQRDFYMSMGTEFDRSDIFIELAGPSLGTDGAHHYYHTITLTSDDELFFEADPENITASFSRLDANKIPMAGDKYVTDFEMISINPETRQISFAIRDSQFVLNNNSKFVFDAYEIVNLVVPENP